MKNRRLNCVWWIQNETIPKSWQRVAFSPFGHLLLNNPPQVCIGACSLFFNLCSIRFLMMMFYSIYCFVHLFPDDSSVLNELYCWIELRFAAMFSFKFSWIKMIRVDASVCMFICACECQWVNVTFVYRRRRRWYWQYEYVVCQFIQ